MGQHRRRQVRAADRLAGLLARLDRRLVDREAELPQPRGHLVGAALAIGARVAQALLEQGAAVVDPVPQHVQVLVVPVDRRDLGGGRDAHSVERSRGQCLVHAVHRVVVGEGEQLDARLGGVRHHVGDPEVTVGVERMGLEVEGRGAHRRPRILGTERGTIFPARDALVAHQQQHGADHGADEAAEVECLAVADAE